MKDNKEKDRDKLREHIYDNNPPAEFIDNVSRDSKSVPMVDENKKDKTTSDHRLEKFKRGELGAAHIRYNDDGDQKGTSRKLDIDTYSELK